MVSVDHFRKELGVQIDCAVARGALDILINAGELCRTLHTGITATDACCKAMRDELRPGDLVLIEAGAGVGMTVKYRLPRPDKKTTVSHPVARG
jgi:hypothetical protein